MTDTGESPVESGFLTGDPPSCRQTPNGTFDNLYDSEENVKIDWDAQSMPFRYRLESRSMDDMNDPQMTRNSQIHYPSSPNIPDSYLSSWIKKEPNHPEISEAESVREAPPEQEQFISNSGETGDNEKKKKKKSSCQISVLGPWCIVGICVAVIIVLAVWLALKHTQANTGSSTEGEEPSTPMGKIDIGSNTEGSLSQCGPPCNESWIWVRGRCYYFSEDTDTWNNSQKFCTEHGSTLAVLIDPDIKKTVQRYQQNNNYWIGLIKNHEEQWMWINGSLNDGEKVDNGDKQYLRCAYLNSHIGALVCSTARSWICVKDSTHRSGRSDTEPGDQTVN